jgi:hypothetical protein
MDPYYVMPAVALALVAGASQGRVRGTLSFAAGLALTVMVFSHPDKWAYWFEMAGLMGAMLAGGQCRRGVGGSDAYLGADPRIIQGWRMLADDLHP